MTDTDTVRTPQVGEIWREVDPRFERFARVQSDGIAGRRGVAIRTVVYRDGRWIDAPTSRSSYADLSRFNGKRGGYEFHEAAP